MRVSELVERVEAATGPDRELDAAIETTVAPERVGRLDLELRAYTASIDAAMTLVLEGWSIGLGDLRGRNPVIWRAHLRDHNPDSLTEAGHSHIWVEGHAATPALALVAAALRAREGDGA